MKAIRSWVQTFHCYNPHYADVQVDEEALNYLPDNGVPADLLTVETDDDISEETVEPDLGPPTDKATDDIVYNKSADMSI